MRVVKRRPKEKSWVLGIRAAPLTNSQAATRRVQTSPPGLVGPLGHYENRVSVIALDDVKDLVGLVEVGQDDRHRPAPVLRQGVRAFHEHRVEHRIEARARSV